MGEEIVSLENVSVYFDHTPILEDVTLSVEKNDFLSVIGPNGGGKTTLLKVILGLIKPAKGKITVFGKSPERGRASIGYLPQHIAFDAQFPITVLDVVLTGRYTKVLRPYSFRDKEIALDALNKVGMSSFVSRQIGNLSGGELQRVFLARALARGPGLLLLDEPTTSIDPDMQRSFYELLSDLKGNMAIVLVTHDISVVSVYVDRIACLNQKLYYHGPVEEGLKNLEAIYQCPIEVLAHGIPHRVLRRHENGDSPI